MSGADPMPMPAPEPGLGASAGPDDLHHGFTDQRMRDEIVRRAEHAIAGRTRESPWWRVQERLAASQPGEANARGPAQAEIDRAVAWYRERGAAAAGAFVAALRAAVDRLAETPPRAMRFVATEVAGDPLWAAPVDGTPLSVVALVAGGRDVHIIGLLYLSGRGALFEREGHEPTMG